MTKASRPLRVLTANVFWTPRRYGGATLVAEEMAARLNARDDTEVVAFTSAPADAGPPYSLLSYTSEAAPVLAVVLPRPDDLELEFDDPAVLPAWREALARVSPDVVHLHSLQSLGAGLLDACREAGVPVVVTLHDAWWLCGRQFMVTGEGRYCGQWRIDLNVCGACVGARRAGLNAWRAARLRSALRGAARLLTPSAFFRDLHLANGFHPGQVAVNRNGVRAPSPSFRRRPAPHLRFGYVGGDSLVKGAALVRRAFAGLEGDYELVLVDADRSLGRPALRAEDWPAGGRVRVRPPYAPETQDEVFAELDVLLFPSQWKESFGLTVREALLRDIWVVATDAGGAVEDIVDGVNGTIIPLEDDGAALRAAAGWAMANRERLLHHSNPLKAQITDFDAEVAELRRYLLEAAGT